MNRLLTTLFAALEALLVVGIGIGISLVPLTILWAFQYGLQIDWIVFWRAAVDIWLLGSGVDVTMTLNPVIASSLGFAGAGTPFVLSIAPLGFALVTVLLGARAGRRIGEIPHNYLGILAAIATFGVLSLGATLSTITPSARPSIWQGALLPTIVFAIGLVAGLVLGSRTSVAARGTASGRSLLDRLGGRPRSRAVATAALTGGAGAAAVVMAVSAVLVAALLLLSYAKIISLYEGVHAAVLGGIAITVGQLAFLPNLVIWAAAWLVGPGFAIGTGSAVSPLGTSLGPIPAIPILGALPSGQFAWGFLGLLIPVLAGFLAAILVRPRLVAALDGRSSAGILIGTGLLIGVVGGVALGLLAWVSAGAAGPGRLVDVGPSPLLVGAFAALEFGVAAVIGLLVGRPPRD
ncbi:DUF6350 family protein [Lacisediminihabitans profunda]|uniref:Uncharacterized protein n=1 Tax=Lacisediminihabitans profunda TaxID=2594790 RepID=A0A5C8UIK9_9MICO|nr:DUF6350 family protein [Lacisediminihabitans profunda]TXN27802.1 hypothetical protein FVP33_18795 [Lacisediminihabitans profunda]